MQADENRRIAGNVPATRYPWTQNGPAIAGYIVAGRCMAMFIFLGVGLLVMGTFTTAFSSNFDNFGGSGQNPPRIIGICMLSFGGFFLLTGIVCIIIAKVKYDRLIRENQASGISPYQPPAPLIAGTSYASNSQYQPQAPPPAYYPPQQSYQHPSNPDHNFQSGQPGPYPTQPLEQYPPPYSEK